MAEPGRARGRGRGRDRVVEAPGPAAAPIPALQGAWARRPGPPAQQPPTYAQPQAQANPRPQAYAQPQGQANPRPQAWAQPQGQANPRPQAHAQPQGQANPRPQAWAQPGPSRPPAVQAAQPPPSRPTGRGTPRVEARRDAEVGDVAGQVQNMGIGAGGGEPAVGRGAMRGRRPIQHDVIVTRPPTLVTKKGTVGDRINLQANYFKLLSITDWCLYQYRVDFAPDEERTMVRKGLLRPHRETLGPYIFDGTVMYTSNRLPEKLELFSQRQSDEAQIRIDIKEVGDLAKGDIHYLQFFNIIMRKCLGHLDLQLVGRDFYDAMAKIEIPEFQLELWPGYMTSIRQHERDILMISEISHKVMRQQTLYHILDDCRKSSQGRSDPRKDFANIVIGQVVLTGYNNNTYRIADVDFTVTPQSTFQLRDGQSISYLDYYKKKYNIFIRNTTQPMLVSKTNPRERRAGQSELLYLVPELCRATGITDDMRAQWPLMKALSEQMCVPPKSRIDKLLAFNQRLRSKPEVQADLKEWNLQLSSSLVEVPGRVLPGAEIVFKGNKVIKAGPRADWTPEMRKVQMITCTQLKTWALIVPSRARRDLENFLKNLIQLSGNLGFAIAQPRIHEIHDDRSHSYTTEIEKICSSLSVQLIFCVVPNNRADRYSAIKKKCCVDRAVPSQVFLAKNLNNKGLQSVATKVGIQMNCKIGGAPWTISVPRIGLMVAGYDVCHDTAQRGRDYGALVASIDPYFTQYFSSVSAHTNGEELSNDLSLNMVKAIRAYQTRNKELPKKIVIYRDGVGEGQVSYVVDHEVEVLKSRLAQVYGKEEYKLAFIIVTKRIKTRIFFRGTNPPPGTIVDDVITDPMKYDFFIVSQSVKQGTVSPTAYSIVSDNSGLSTDALHQLSYRLTHMYYNWSGTVRVPAPCQYAHKLAFLVSQSIHTTPHQQLDNLLYFL